MFFENLSASSPIGVGGFIVSSDVSPPTFRNGSSVGSLGDPSVNYNPSFYCLSDYSKGFKVKFS